MMADSQSLLSALILPTPSQPSQVQTGRQLFQKGNIQHFKQRLTTIYPGFCSFEALTPPGTTCGPAKGRRNTGRYPNEVDDPTFNPAAAAEFLQPSVSDC